MYSKHCCQGIRDRIRRDKLSLYYFWCTFENLKDHRYTLFPFSLSTLIIINNYSIKEIG